MESGKISVGHLPASVSAYRQRRMSLADEVIAASARPDEAFMWITVVSESVDENMFADSTYPWQYPT